MPAWWRELLSYISPERCHACLGQVQEDIVEHQFCANCTFEMTKGAGITCFRCGAEVAAHIETTSGCLACLRDRFAFDQVLRMGPYDGLLREIVLKCKQSNGEILAEAAGYHFGCSLKNSAALDLPTAIVPVPSHWTRLLWRGHNPALGVALGLARALKVPCCPNWLRRTRPTPRQTTLTPKQRRLNLNGAIRHYVPARAKGCTVWIVDDVLTTGTTASAGSRALLDGGAGKVVAVVLARGG